MSGLVKFYSDLSMHDQHPLISWPTLGRMHQVDWIDLRSRSMYLEDFVLLTATAAGSRCDHICFVWKYEKSVLIAHNGQIKETRTEALLKEHSTPEWQKKYAAGRIL